MGAAGLVFRIPSTGRLLLDTFSQLLKIRADRPGWVKVAQMRVNLFPQCLLAWPKNGGLET